jgi:hypothetical protein
MDPQDTRTTIIEPNMKYGNIAVVPGMYSVEFKGDGLESKSIQLIVPSVAIPDTMLVKVTLNASQNAEDLKNTNIWKPLSK